MPIASYLLDKNITLVGIMKANRIGIPRDISDMKDRDLSTLYAVEEKEKLLLASYVVKKSSGKRNVLVLSTMHNNAKVTKDARKKPHVIAFYDRTKEGVDVMDMIAGFFTTKFKTRRWTLNALAYILDTAKTNALTIYRDIHPGIKERSFEFVWELAEELVKPHVLSRFHNPVGLQQPTMHAITVFLKSDIQDESCSSAVTAASRSSTAQNQEK